MDAGLLRIPPRPLSHRWSWGLHRRPLSASMEFLWHCPGPQAHGSNSCILTSSPRVILFLCSGGNTSCSQCHLCPDPITLQLAKHRTNRPAVFSMTESGELTLGSTSKKSHPSLGHPGARLHPHVPPPCSAPSTSPTHLHLCPIFHLQRTFFPFHFPKSCCFFHYI